MNVLLKYWEFDESSCSFSYKTNYLANLLGFKTYQQLSKFARDNSFATLNNTNSICDTCKTRYKSHSRQGLDQLPRQKKTCDSCKKMIQNEFLSAKLEWLNEKLDEFKLEPAKNFEPNSLSYFELIFLYMFIKPNSKFRKIFYKKNKLNFTSSCDLDNKILCNLITKKIVFEFSKLDYDKVVFNDYHFERSDFPLYFDGLIWGFNYADKELKRSLIELFKAKLPKYGIHILLPQNFNNFLEFKECVNRKLKNYSLKEVEIEQIESVILQQRLDLAMKMVKGISKHFRLKIEPSIKLEFLLIDLLKKHKIEEVHSFIYNVASRSKHYLEFVNPDFNKYGKKYLFTKSLENKIEYIDNLETPLFKKSLPNFMKNTKLEEFFNLQIASKNKTVDDTWENLSVNEIIASWLNSFDKTGL